MTALHIAIGTNNLALTRFLIEDAGARLGPDRSDLALSVADYFELKPAQARAIAAEVATSVSSWRNVAAHIDLTAKGVRSYGYSL